MLIYKCISGMVTSQRLNLLFHPSLLLYIYFALHFTTYLFTALSKIMSHSKTIKNATKLSVFGENDSRRFSNFLQTHIFWNFDHISKIYNQTNYRNIWFPKAIRILVMTAQVLFFDVFSEKEPHLNAVGHTYASPTRKIKVLYY